MPNALKFGKQFTVLFKRRTKWKGSIRTFSLSVKPEKLDDEKLWIHSPLDKVDTVVGLTMPELLREEMGPFGHLTAFECAETGVKYTHNETFRNGQGFAAALIKAGFRPGEIIGVVLPNRPEYMQVLLGVWDAGLIASPINPSYTAEEIRRQLQSSDSVCVVCDEEYLSTVLKVKETNPKIRSVIVVGEAREGCHTFKEMVKQDTFGVNFFKGSHVDTTEAIALLPYSSGTTGPPKGVCLTHSNITTNVRQLDPKLGTFLMKKYQTGQEQERTLGLLPFFHSYGLSCLLTMTSWLGSHTLCIKKFEPDSFLQAVRSHRPTCFHLVTPLLNHIVHSKDYGKKEFEAAHTVVAAAAPIGKTLITSLLEKADKYLFFQEGYGMTELSPCSHILLPNTENRMAGSCGVPVASTTSKLVDVKTGETVGRNTPGELCIRGPQVMKGYYKNEEATRNTIDAEGWLHTGDVAIHDDNGYCFIVDRLKELIKVKGLQVAPSELEDILRDIPSVDDVAVIGIPAPERGAGELPRAYIVRNNSNLSEDDIHKHLAPLVSDHKQLKGGIEFIKAIPKAPSGKILRRELKDAYCRKYNVSNEMNI